MEYAVIAAVAIFAVALAVTALVIRMTRGGAPNEPTRHPGRPAALDREGVAAQKADPNDLAPASERIANRP